jgi:hypothetical protein
MAMGYGREEAAPSQQGTAKVRTERYVFAPGDLSDRMREVSRPWLRKFIRFTYFQMCGQSKIRIHVKSMKRFKDKVREPTGRKRGKSLRIIPTRQLIFQISRAALVRDPYAKVVWEASSVIGSPIPIKPWISTEPRASTQLVILHLLCDFNRLTWK